MPNLQRLNNVQQYDVEQILRYVLGFADERRHHVEHAIYHFWRVLRTKLKQKSNEIDIKILEHIRAHTL